MSRTEFGSVVVAVLLKQFKHFRLNVSTLTDFFRLHCEFTEVKKK